jgi:radical SAM protein with 4Fe4S-binding SPASM domain
VNRIFKLKKFPDRITLEVTNRCNLGCTFCPRHLVDMNLGNMEWPLFKRIVDESSKYLPVTLVLFFRGESLIHPDLPKMIQYAKENGLGPIQLASNGFLLTDEMGEELINAGLDFISFSLDTIDKEIYQKTRVNSDLQIAMDNVIDFVNLCQIKKSQGYKVPEIQVSSVDVEEYRKSQPDFIDFWRKYADRVRIYMEHSSDGNLGSINKELLINKVQRKPCGKIYTDIVIYWNGDIALCNHDWNNELAIGNVKEQSIAEIWHSDAYKDIRQMHEKTQFIENMTCAHCDHWQMYYLPEGFIGQVYEKSKVVKGLV